MCGSLYVEIVRQEDLLHPVLPPGVAGDFSRVLLAYGA